METTPVTAPTIDTLQSLLRYVAPTDRGTGHLLPNTWTRDKHRNADARPSLCRAVWTARWRNTDHIDRHVDPCTECSIAAGLVEHRPPVPIVRAVRPQQRPVWLTGPSATATALDPQGEHARIPGDHRILRGPYLPSIPHSPEALAYVERVYGLDQPDQTDPTE
jgi:hypothetical protein